MKLKIKKHIEIVSSTLNHLSSMGQGSRESVQAVLSKHYSKVGITIVNDLADLEALVAAKPDLVFLGMKFIPSEPTLGLADPDKIWIANYLDSHRVVSTGSGSQAHELEFNKPQAKQMAIACGIKTSPFNVARKGYQFKEGDHSLRYPVFIKPTNRGGGLGIDSNSVAHNFGQLQVKVRSIAVKHGADSLIEEYLPGREFSVAILKDDVSGELRAMPIELVAPLNKHGLRILSSEVKAADSETHKAVDDQSINTKITEQALSIFKVLGGRDYGRIDIRLDGQFEPHFLEANLMPSLIENYGNFPKACGLNLNLGYDAMILAIVRLAFRRDLNAYEDSSDSQFPVAIPPYIFEHALEI